MYLFSVNFPEANTQNLLSSYKSIAVPPPGYHYG